MIIGAFRTVSFHVLQDGACLDSVDQRLARKVARHAVNTMLTHQGHPIHKVFSSQDNGIYRSPLADTVLRYRPQVQEDCLVGISSMLPYALQPWTTLPQIAIPHSAEEAIKRYKLAIQTQARLVFYPDASVRNNVASVAVTVLDFGKLGRIPKLIYQATVGWEHTCSATAAELKGIELAVLHARSAGRHFSIATDSQESITLINKRGRSAKARDAVGAVLRAIGSCLEEGLDFDILWLPAHKGIVGNEAADRAARQLNEVPGRPTRVPAFRVSERPKVMGIVEESQAGDHGLTVALGKTHLQS